MSEAQLEFRRAITALVEAELIGPDDIQKMRPEIQLPGWQIDAIIWKVTPKWEAERARAVGD